MNKIKVNGNEINFYIDYVRVHNNCGQSYGDYGYHCDLDIVSDKKLTSYEKEIVERTITRCVNDFDKLVGE